MTTVQLTEDNERFVSASLAEGLYGSRDELLNDALHSLQQEREWRRHAEEGIVHEVRQARHHAPVRGEILQGDKIPQVSARAVGDDLSEGHVVVLKEEEGEGASLRGEGAN